jgi:hypothetical protein
MTTHRIYVLACHTPITLPGSPYPASASVWDSRALLDSRLPGPDAMHLHHLIVSPPWRHPGQVVPLSTVTAEVGGNLDTTVAGWSHVITELLQLSRAEEIEALPLSLNQRRWELLQSPPTGQVTAIDETGSTVLAAAARAELVEEITRHVDSTVADASDLDCGTCLTTPLVWANAPVMTQADR